MRLLAQAYLEWNSQEHWQKALRAVAMAEEVHSNVNSYVAVFIARKIFEAVAAVQSPFRSVLARSCIAE